ncbi:MAG: ATP-binding protein, partial [Rhizobiaceae bacterium]
DDFGYKTQYQLIYHGDDAEDEIYVGNVKILKKGQGETRRGLLDEGPLTSLGTDYCSLGQSLDYYERLADLPRQARISIARALRDVVYRPGLVTKFRGEPGWRTSILRDIDDLGEFTGTASVLLSKDYSSLADVSLELAFKPRGWKKSIALDFDAPSTKQSSSSRFRIPKRVAVVVGRNGTGKSTLLARFARVAHAPQRMRRQEPIRSLGTLTPKGVGFTRIIAVSYSAFDSFQIPGVTIEERRQIARDVGDGVGRYIFCGLRDIAGEMNAVLKPESDEDLETPVDSGDLAKTTLLKPIETLAEEFDRTIERIRSSQRSRLLREALEPIFADPSFGGDEDQTVSAVIGDSPKDTFLRWSTGHKIVMQIVASLAAYTQPKSIILLDEPETHLHPPLLAALMHSVRFILEEQDAFA